MPRFAAFVGLLLIGWPAASSDVHAQAPEAAIRAVVMSLFDGMRAGDSTAVRSVFHEDARLVTVLESDGAATLREGSVDGFVRAVGTRDEAVWDERVWDVMINEDGPLASAWMRYAFYLGDTFSHCGVDAFQLAHTADGWKIFNLTDTRQKDGCNVPPDLQ